MVLPLTGEFRSFPKTTTSSCARRMGTVKKTAAVRLLQPRKAGIIAVDLDEGD